MVESGFYGFVRAEAVQFSRDQFDFVVKSLDHAGRKSPSACKTLTEQERAKLVKFGSQLGGALNELVTIVHPNTLRRWIRESNNPKKDSTKTPAKKGRPKT